MEDPPIRISYRVDVTLFDILYLTPRHTTVVFPSEDLHIKADFARIGVPTRPGIHE